VGPDMGTTVKTDRCSDSVYVQPVSTVNSRLVAKPDKSPDRFPAGFHFDVYGVFQDLGIFKTDAAPLAWERRPESGHRRTILFADATCFPARS